MESKVKLWEIKSGMRSFVVNAQNITDALNKGLKSKFAKNEEIELSDIDSCRIIAIEDD